MNYKLKDLNVNDWDLNGIFGQEELRKIMKFVTT
jgi:hypothetical protein